VGQGNADECLGADGRQVFHQLLPPHARIDHHRNRPHPKEGEGNGEQLQGRPDHEDGFHPPDDAGPLETMGQTVRLFVQLAERPVDKGAGGGRADHGLLLGQEAGDATQMFT